MTQRVIPIVSPNFIDAQQKTSPLDWTEVFDNHHPLALEIGCGTGDFILQQAHREPMRNYLAIDIYNKGCLKTCSKIDASGIQNVRVMRVEARWLLTKYLRKESLAAVYINCPDPWPKKRHRRRRLVNRDFLENLAHYLMPGGEFFFSTDFLDYAEEVADSCHQIAAYRNMLPSSWATTLQDYPLSKYMLRFLERKQKIFFIHHCRDNSISRNMLPQPPMKRGFRICWQAAKND